jgi:muramoyltetrapeptide carboxypeptidase LdcA involved in peptidoglycan recycling
VFSLKGINFKLVLTPALKNTIIFLEEDALTAGETAVVFDRDLQSLVQQSGFEGVQGVVIGRFQQSSAMSYERLKMIVQNKKELQNLPVIANVDFGHTDPMITFPIGGKIKIIAEKDVRMTVLQH